MATLRRLIDDPPPAMASLNPELPPWFVSIVERLLEKEPARRFGSAKEVSELLEGCLAHVQQPAERAAARRGFPSPAGRLAGMGGGGEGGGTGRPDRLLAARAENESSLL